MSSRCDKWHKAMSGISKHLESVGIPDRGYDHLNIVSKFCRQEKYKGSRSDKYLFVSDNFNKFKQFIKQNHDKRAD